MYPETSIPVRHVPAHATTGVSHVALVDDDAQAARHLEAEPPHASAEDTASTPVASSEPSIGFWELLLWVLGWFAAQLVGAVVAYIATYIAAPEAARETAMTIVMLGGQVCAVAVGLLAVRLRFGRGWLGQLNLRLPGLRQCLLAVLCLPGLMALAVVAVVLTEHLSGGTDATRGIVGSVDTAPLWLVLLTVAGGAALNEELWFRGFLGRGLVGRYGVLVGVLVASFFFALVHLNLPQAVGAFLLGIGFHLIYLATRSLWVPVLLHLLNNSRVVLCAYFLQPGTTPDESETGEVLLIVGVMLAVSAVAAYALYRVRVRPTHRGEGGLRLGPCWLT